MSIIRAVIPNSNYYKNTYFSLKLDISDRKTKIQMDLYTTFLDTGNIPQTYQILKRELPSIMFSKCFNEKNFTFAREVRNTEIGHLFEHIVLEYVCDLKRLAGIKNPVHNGLTSWNWQKDPGRFYISMDVTKKDDDALRVALQRSTELLIKVIESSPLPKTYASSELEDLRTDLKEIE